MSEGAEVVDSVPAMTSQFLARFTVFRGLLHLVSDDEGRSRSPVGFCLDPTLRVNPGNITQYIKVQCFSMPTAPSQAFYDQYCNPATPLPTCINLLGNARRNILAGPGLVNLDFSVYKNTRISEKLTTQFRAEFFNVVNRANFQSPLDNNTIFDQNGNLQDGVGALGKTANDSREIQFGLKFLW